MATAEAQFLTNAEDVDGTAGQFLPDGQEFEGAQIIDYDEFVDRNEELHLLRASHHIDVYTNATSTADGTVRGVAEISSAPSLQSGHELESGGGETTFSDFNVNGDLFRDDTIDTLGRPLQAVGHSPFSDGSTGAGGGGYTGSDDVELGTPPVVIGRFHPRDELFINGTLEASNVDDAGLHMDVVVQHLYGVASQ